MSSTVGDTHSREFAAAMKGLPDILAFIRSMTSLLTDNDDFLFRTRLACEEAIVNIIKHSCGKKPGAKILVQGLIEANSIIIRIQDPGPPFDPVQFYQMSQNGDNEIAIGVRLMMKSADTIEYARVDSVNHLSLYFMSSISKVH